MRRAFGGLLLGLVGCAAGFSNLERGDWRRVHSQKAADSFRPEELITRERFDDEVAAGEHRDVIVTPEAVFPVLNELQELTLSVGEVRELRVSEAEGEIELQVKGRGVDWYWNPAVKRDEWVDGEGLVHHQSALFAVGRSAGKSSLRLLVGGENGRVRDLSVTVH